MLFIPFGVLAMNYVLGFVGLVGARASWRLRGEIRDRKKREVEGEQHDVILIGAGEAGVVVAREIANRPDLGLPADRFSRRRSAESTGTNRWLACPWLE